MLRFEKWEGLGNDFVVVEAADVGADFGPKEARILCDRRFGIGADGVLVVVRGEPGVDGRMIVWNADGSRPEMCGNGLRCVASALVSPGQSARLVIATDAGPRTCDLARDGDRAEVTIGMGRATFGEPLVVAIDGREHRFATASMGNPHAITFEPYAEALRDRVGPIVCTTPPEGTNVEFVAQEGEVLRVVVWERGVGYTLACGTGACAVAAEAVRTGRAEHDRELRVALPGGELAIVLDRSFEVRMRGPARRVFAGTTTLLADPRTG